MTEDTITTGHATLLSAEYVRLHNAATTEFKVAFAAVGARMWPMDRAHALKPANQEFISGEMARMTFGGLLAVYGAAVQYPLTVLDSYPEVSEQDRADLREEVGVIGRKYNAAWRSFLLTHAPLDTLNSSVKDLYEYGRWRAVAFLEANSLPSPIFSTDASAFSATAPLIGRLTGYYEPRGGRVYVNLAVTARPVARPSFRSWSYPGYKVDRTAVGVVAHEVGHHIQAEMARDHRWRGAEWRVLVRREKVTSYEPVPDEAFAETMRLFILNPDLLRRAAPGRYRYAAETLGLVPAEQRPYQEVPNQHPAYVTAASRWCGEGVAMDAGSNCR